MLIDRRSFMQAAALVVVGDLLSPSSNVRAYASSLPASVPTETAVAETGTKHVFKVDGWDQLCDPVGDEVFIRVNQAWRTAWR